MNPDLPYQGGHGPHGFESGIGMLPFLGTFLLLAVLLVATAFYLTRTGKLTWPIFAGRPSPEEDAKRILAERFARGDLSSEDFLERSSMLNWTPGSDTLPPAPRKRRRLG